MSLNRPISDKQLKKIYTLEDEVDKKDDKQTPTPWNVAEADKYEEPEFPLFLLIEEEKAQQPVTEDVKESSDSKPMTEAEYFELEKIKKTDKEKKKNEDPTFISAEEKKENIEREKARIEISKPTIDLIANYFKQVFPKIHNQETPKEWHSIFDSYQPISISIADFFLQLFQKTTTNLWGHDALIGLVYVNRIYKKHPEIIISERSIHRLLLTCLMLAVKFYEDVYFNNATWEKGNLQKSELNKLEKEVLSLLDFNLNVSLNEIEEIKKILTNQVAGTTPPSNQKSENFFARTTPMALPLDKPRKPPQQMQVKDFFPEYKDMVTTVAKIITEEKLPFTMSYENQKFSFSSQIFTEKEALQAKNYYDHLYYKFGRVVTLEKNPDKTSVIHLNIPLLYLKSLQLEIEPELIDSLKMKISQILEHQQKSSVYYSKDKKYIFLMAPLKDVKDTEIRSLAKITSRGENYIQADGWGIVKVAVKDVREPSQTIKNARIIATAAEGNAQRIAARRIAENARIREAKADPTLQKQTLFHKRKDPKNTKSHPAGASVHRKKS